MKRETLFWTLVLCAGIALGGYRWWGAEQRGAQPPGDAMAREDLLLPRGLDEIERIEFSYAGAQRVIRRQDRAWRYADGDRPGSAARAAPALAAEAAFIGERLAMFAVARIDRELDAPLAQGARFGIAAQRGSVKLIAAGSARARLSLIVGERTPDGFGQYLRIEPPARLVIVPAYHVDNLMRLFHGR